MALSSSWLWWQGPQGPSNSWDFVRSWSGVVKGLWWNQVPSRLGWDVACFSLQNGDTPPLTDVISESSEIMHIKWFAQWLALARGLKKIICYFCGLVKLARKHATTRMARESWLRISDYKCSTPYLGKHPSHANLLFKTQGWYFLFSCWSPTTHCQDSLKKLPRKMKQVWSKSPTCLSLTVLKSEMKPACMGAASLLCSEGLTAPREAWPPMWPVRTKLLYVIRADGCPLTDPLTVSGQWHVQWPGKLTHSHSFTWLIRGAFWQTNGRPEDELMMTPETDHEQRTEVTDRSTNVFYSPARGGVFNIPRPPRSPGTQSVPGVPMFKAKVALHFSCSLSITLLAKVKIYWFLKLATKWWLWERLNIENQNIME